MTQITYNGATYFIPSSGDQSWGDSLSAYLIALSTGSLSHSGGIFQLTGDLNWGSTNGLVAEYFSARNALSSSNIASKGSDLTNPNRLRLGVIPNADPAQAVYDNIAWRNNANTGDLILTPQPGMEGNLLYNGLPLLTSAIIPTKQSVTAATTANITLSGTQAIDSISIVVGNRVLVKNQTTQSQNGIYVAAAGTWSRAADMNVSAEFNDAQVAVLQGTANASTIWIQTTTSPTLGTDPIVWQQISGSGTYTADNTTLQLSGSQFSIKSGGVTDTQVSASAAIAGTKISPNFGSQNIVTTGVSTANNFQDIYNVKFYGATGDGTTDDTVSIQAALTAVPSAGGRVYLPTGTYLISATLTPKSNTYIYGDASGTTIKTGTTKVGSQVGFFQANNVSNISILNIKFDGGGSWTSTPFANPYGGGNSVGFTNADAGIKFTQSGGTTFSNFVIQNCEFTGLGYGVFFDGSNKLTNIHISNNYIHNMGQAGVAGYNINQFIISNNIISGIYGNLTTAGDTTVTDSQFADGIYIASSLDGVVSSNFINDFIRCGTIVEPNGGTVSKRLNISSNTITHGHDSKGGQALAGIYISDGTNSSPIEVSSNTIDDMNGGWGIISQNTNISSCAIKNCTIAGIQAVTATDISNVEIISCAIGIDAELYSAGDYLTIKNSTITNSTSSGIQLFESHGNFDITGNTFIDNSTIGIKVVRYYNDQKILIKSNTFISSAAQSASAGQLYGIYVVAGGDFNFTTEYIQDNIFLFTGSFSASYPNNMQIVPTSFAYDNTSTITVYEITNTYGNFNSKLPYSGTQHSGYATGFPRFLGYASSAPVSGSFATGDYFINLSLASGQPFMFICVSGGSPGTWESWGGSQITLAAVGSSPNANAASYSASGVLNLQPANASFPGVVTTGTQTFAGSKTFSSAPSFSSIINSGTLTLPTSSDTIVGRATTDTLTNKTIAAGSNTISGLTNSNLSGSAAITNANLASMANNSVKGNTSGVSATPSDLSLGTTTESTSSVLTLSGWSNSTIGSPTIQVKQASTSQSGYLSSTDWNTFNGKASAGSYITALTGDGTASGPGSVALTLATVNTNTGSFGSSTAIPTFTVNGKGLITAASTVAVIAPAGTLSGTTLNSTVVSSSLTSVGTLATLTVTATITGSVSGNAATATALQTGRTINGTTFDGTSNITVTAAAGTLTGTTLNSTVVSSSLTSVGTLTNLTVTNPISGSVTGNAATVTTNANLTGVVTSVGNATSIASSAITDAMLAVSYLKADGSRALTGNWAAGAFSATHNSVIVGSAANTISALRTIISDTSLTFQTNNGTTAGSISTAQAWTINGRLGIFGAPNANFMLDIGNGASGFTGTTQVGALSEIVGTSSATSNVRGFQSSVGTAASTTTSVVQNFYATGIAKGASGTITNTINYMFDDQTVGTNNAAIADNTSSSGNWFINYSGSRMSTMGAALALTGYQTASPSSAGTVTMSARVPGLLLTPATTLAVLTIQLPSSPVDGQSLWIASSQQLTAVTWQDAGGTAANVIGGQATIGGTNRGQGFVYSSGTSKWYAIS